MSAHNHLSFCKTVQGIGVELFRICSHRPKIFCARICILPLGLLAYATLCAPPRPCSCDNFALQMKSEDWDFRELYLVFSFHSSTRSGFRGTIPLPFYLISNVSTPSLPPSTLLCNPTPKTQLVLPATPQCL
jgi:hypothetical protein